VLVLDSILSTSLSSRIIGPLAIFSIVEPEIDALRYLNSRSVGSICDACFYNLATRFVCTCIFCMIALELDGEVYTAIADVVVGA
jgi:hypothetical protein